MRRGRAVSVLVVALAIAGAPGAARAQVQQQVAGSVVIELAVKPRPQVAETAMIFSITSLDGKPIPTAQATGRAEFSSGGLRGTATLYPDGANRMKGYGLMSAKPDLTITVSIVLPSAAPARAVFHLQPVVIVMPAKPSPQ